VELTSEQRATLQSWQSAAKTEQRLAFRARIILAVADGLNNKGVAGRLATRPCNGQQVAWPGSPMRHSEASRGTTAAKTSGEF
jgi:hypothetical protein